MHQIELWALIPFAVMLLSIAILPMVVEKWWEKNSNKLLVSLSLAAITAIYMASSGAWHNIEHQMLFDYVPFIILLCALFVITGGIHISGDIAATPRVNTTILAIGFCLASIMGTTGAAMLLIRPLLQINKQRVHKAHTILFFIALVANCGGVLTPLGDPPLFLLYLRQAPFTWFLGLLPEWLFVGILLLTIYFIWDRIAYRREPAEAILRDNTEKAPLKVSGSINFVYLIGTVLAVAFINQSYIPAMGDEHAPLYVKFLRVIVLVVLILFSLKTTSLRVRQNNRFSWAPITEVAILFIGIFATMTPALLYLNAHTAELGLTRPWQFFYSTGTLSSFLDNAPTALAFHSVASGLPVDPQTAYVAGIPEILLKAISLGAVFFGAMTYIGNGPNFMVKSIAEENGVTMPSFFGYMIRFSLIVLLPIYILTQLIFL